MGDELPGMVLHLRHDSSCGLPTGSLVEKALVPHDGLMARPPHRARQQFFNVAQPQLVAAGLPNFVDSRFLQLFALGIEQPMRITGAEGNGVFGPQAAIEFYGRGLDSPYSDTEVYWFVVGDSPGKRIHEQPVLEEGGPRWPSFLHTVEIKQRTTYFAALLKENTDNFFGALVSSTPVDQVLKAVDLAPTIIDDVKLEVGLQGVVAGAPHDVTVSVNGAIWETLTSPARTKVRSVHESLPISSMKVLTPLP